MSETEVTDTENVPLDLLRRYMRARGWRNATPSEMPPVRLPPERLAAYRTFIEARGSGDVDYDLMINPRGDLSKVRLAIPKNTSGPDYASRIERAVELLSKIEAKSINFIIRAIRAVGFDAIYSRLPNTVVRSNTISFITAAEHISSLKAALVNTAMTEVRPVSHFDQPLKAATDYAESCRFGHTFRGSFGFTIESPIVPNETPSLLPEVEPAPPFERRVVTRFVRGLRAVRVAGETGDRTALLEGPEKGFSANAYDAVADMIEASVIGLAIDFNFSPEWRPPPDLAEQTSVELAPVHAELAREASRALRNRLTPESVDITGVIVNLRSEQNPQLIDAQGSRLITLKWNSPKHGEIRIAVRVSAEDYLKAIPAHTNGQSVKVRGTLEYRRGWFLVDPSPLDVPAGA